MEFLDISSAEAHAAILVGAGKKGIWMQNEKLKTLIEKHANTFKQAQPRGKAKLTIHFNFKKAQKPLKQSIYKTLISCIQRNTTQP